MGLDKLISRYTYTYTYYIFGITLHLDIFLYIFIYFFSKFFFSVNSNNKRMFEKYSFGYSLADFYFFSFFVQCKIRDCETDGIIYLGSVLLLRFWFFFFVFYLFSFFFSSLWHQRQPTRRSLTRSANCGIQKYLRIDLNYFNQIYATS